MIGRMDMRNWIPCGPGSGPAPAAVSGPRRRAAALIREGR